MTTRKPELSQYPKWLRELIFPEELSGRSWGPLQDLQENEKAMRQIFENYRVRPELRILWMITLEVIRYRFRFYEIERGYTNRIAGLDEKVRSLEIHIMKVEAAVAKLEVKRERLK